MNREIQIQVTPVIAANDHLLKQHLAKISKIAFNDIQHAPLPHEQYFWTFVEKNLIFDNIK